MGKATFSDTNPGELNAYEETAHEAARPQCRYVYASWCPDQGKLARSWIDYFKERIDNGDFRVWLGIEPGEAGKSVEDRDHLDKELRAVTDFVIVGTMPYFNEQRRLGQKSVLSWMLQTSSKSSSLAIWLAALENNLPIKRLTLHGVPDLPTAAQLWHPTKSDKNAFEAFTFPRADDLGMQQRFSDEITRTVDRISEHNDRCEVCHQPMSEH
jgi:hypothetical protein